MSSYAQITLFGKVTKGDIKFPQVNPQSQEVEKPLVFSVAIAGKKKKGEDKAKVYFYRVTAWGNTAIFASKEVKAGATVMVIGTLEPEMYKNNNGEEVLSLNVTASVIKSDTPFNAETYDTSNPMSSKESDEDIPF